MAVSWCLPAETKPTESTPISRLWVPYQSRTRWKLCPQKPVDVPVISWWDEQMRPTHGPNGHMHKSGGRQHVPLKHGTYLPNYTALHSSASSVNELCLPVPIQTDCHSLIHSAASLRCSCPNTLSWMHTFFCRGVKSTQTLINRNKSKIQAMDIKYLRRIAGKVRWNGTRHEVVEKLEWSGHVNMCCEFHLWWKPRSCGSQYSASFVCTRPPYMLQSKLRLRYVYLYHDTNHSGLRSTLGQIIITFTRF
jgi:hypothetical protein